MAWASEQGTPVQMPACIDFNGAIICYGLTGDPTTGNHGVLVALAVAPDGITELGFVPLPFGTPAPVPTSPEGARPGGATSFGDGTWRVGVDIEPGTYRAVSESDRCHWERLSGFGGAYEEVIEWDSAYDPGPVIVSIDPTDAGFTTTGCGTWTRVEQ